MAVTVFDNDEPTSRLVSVTGIGSFGKGVVDRLQTLLPLLPETVRLAADVTSLDSPDDLRERLPQARQKLASLEHTEKLVAAGRSLEGREHGLLRIYHYVVCSVDQRREATESGVGRPSMPSDVVIWICNCGDERPKRAATDASSTLIVSQTNANGEHVVPSSVEASVAGALLLALLPNAPGSLHANAAGWYSLGFAGLYGLAGPALERLAAEAAYALVCEHASNTDPSSGQPPPEPVESACNDYSPRTLGLKLFDSTVLGELRPPSIPAVAEWTEEGLLRIALDRAKVALQLPNDEAEWVGKIEAISRTFDMTAACAWKSQLNRAGAAVAEWVRTSFEARIQEILYTLPRSPLLVEHILTFLGRELDAPRRSMSYTNSEPEEALETLKKAVEQQPNPIALSLRTALLVLPAAVAGASVIGTLYTGFRGVIFPIAFVVLLLGGASAWLLTYVARARSRLFAARARAIDAFISRQEGLLSANALAALDQPLKILRAQLKSARALLAAYRSDLEGIRVALETRRSVPLQAPLTLQPMLMNPEEYALALKKLNIEVTDWLRDSAAARAFGDLGRHADKGDTHPPPPDRKLGRLLAWCQERLHRIEPIVLPWETLWEIRRARARTNGDRLAAFAADLKIVRNRAAPLAPCEGRSDQAVVFVPSVLTADVRAAMSEARLSDDRIIAVGTLPLLAWLEIERSRTEVPA